MKIRATLSVLVTALMAMAPAIASASTHNPELVSAGNDGTPLTNADYGPQMSDDGNVVSFTTTHDSGEEERDTKTYVRDRAARSTTLVSDVNGSLDDENSTSALSGNGRYLISYTWLQGDGKAKWVKYDVKTHESTAFKGPNIYTNDVSVSDGGGIVAARNGDDGHAIDVVNTTTGASHPVASSGKYNDVHISGDGTTIAYAKYSGTVDGNVLEKVYKQRLDGTPQRVDIGADGKGSAKGHVLGVDGLSDNGRHVLFEEATGAGIASECDPATGADPFHPDLCLFRRDTLKGRTVVANRDASGKVVRAAGFDNVAISDNGTRVSFIAAFGEHTRAEVRVRDISAGRTLTVGRNAAGELPNQEPWDSTLSGNGKTAAILSSATNYGVQMHDKYDRKVFAAPVPAR